jgi:hypothetical protein
MARDEVSELSPDDLAWLQRAEDHISRLLQTRYEEAQLNRTQADLILRQRLIDERRIKPEQVLEAQCIGFVLGNVIASHTPKKWKRVKNEYGDMLALVDPATGFTLYPLTMITKRLDGRREVDLPALYRDLAEIN